MKTNNAMTEWASYCNKFNAGASRSELMTAAQREAARLNGAKGGRPKKPSARTPNS